MFPRLGLTCVALLALAACGGGEDAVSTTLPLPPETVATLPAETTDVEPAETTAAPTTNPTPTTSSTTTSTTTTEPFNEPSDLAATIQRDASAAEVALLEAIGDPGSARARELANRHFYGETLNNLLELLDQLVIDGLVGQPNPDVTSTIVLLSEPVLVNGAGTRAEAKTCRVDAGMIVEPSTSGDGPLIIVNDRILRTIADTRFVLDDGVWKLDGGDTIDETVGATSCDI